MNDLELAQDLTALVAETPGVTAVYASGSPIRAVLHAVVDAVGSAGDDAAKVAVTRHRDGSLTVDATISVDSGAPVPATLRLVGDAVRGHLLTQPDSAPVREIDVRVCRIEDALR
ncbi:hypothetical protein KXS11_10810 [Plantibacter flavus]|uniref:hypothetical protein n=1 Tax=Plantibacter flavus TaxID=150123 RepID=UPI003F14A934